MKLKNLQLLARLQLVLNRTQWLIQHHIRILLSLWTIHPVTFQRPFPPTPSCCLILVTAIKTHLQQNFKQAPAIQRNQQIIAIFFQPRRRQNHHSSFLGVLKASTASTNGIFTLTKSSNNNPPTISAVDVLQSNLYKHYEIYHHQRESNSY